MGGDVMWQEVRKIISALFGIATVCLAAYCFFSAAVMDDADPTKTDLLVMGFGLLLLAQGQSK